MKNNNHFLKKIFISSLLGFIVIIGGCSSDLQQSTIEPHNNVNGNIFQQHFETDDEKIANLVKSLRTIDPKQGEGAKSQLKVLSRESPENKKFINNYLLYETKKLCTSQDVGYHPDVMEGSRFSQLKYISELLADFQNIESLETLVDCSNHTNILNQGKSTSYATMRSVISFKEKAIPVLKEKLSHSSPDIKCRIATMLSIISPKEAEPTLKEALKADMNKKVLRCFSFYIKAIENN